MITTSKSLAFTLQSQESWLILTGAGCSTEAGLGDYRDQNGEWKRPQPITGQTFRNDELARKRYWARGFVGWPHFANATPTTSHKALAQLQHTIKAPQLITQNVDYLHQQAGHKNVTDLHGVLNEVVCLECNQITLRSEMQERLSSSNPWLNDLDAAYAPDGDADLENSITDSVILPNCIQCEGMLKPNVVFFGENVPRDKVNSCFDALSAAKGLLVVGSSMMVYSGFRFCRRAHELNKRIVLVNNGKTRADPLATEKYEGECGGLLQQAADELSKN